MDSTITANTSESQRHLDIDIIVDKYKYTHITLLKSDLELFHKFWSEVIASARVREKFIDDDERRFRTETKTLTRVRVRIAEIILILRDRESCIGLTEASYLNRLDIDNDRVAKTFFKIKEDNTRMVYRPYWRPF
jgi:hypothetical protein